MVGDRKMIKQWRRGDPVCIGGQGRLSKVFLNSQGMKLKSYKCRNWLKSRLSAVKNPSANILRQEQAWWV
jgi:hypothetical protein